MCNTRKTVAEQSIRGANTRRATERSGRAEKKIESEPRRWRLQRVIRRIAARLPVCVVRTRATKFVQHSRLGEIADQLHRFYALGLEMLGQNRPRQLGANRVGSVARAKSDAFDGDLQPGPWSRTPPTLIREQELLKQREIRCGFFRLTRSAIGVTKRASVPTG